MTRASSAVMTSTGPDQFSAVMVHSRAAWCMPAMLTKRLLGLEGVVGERPILRIGLGSPAGRRWLLLREVQGGEPVEELLRLSNRVQHVVRGGGAADGLRVVGAPHEDADAPPRQGSEGVLVGDVVAQIDGDHVVSV